MRFALDCAIVIALAATGSARAETKSPGDMVREVALWWAGSYDNTRQFEFDAAWRRGELAAVPELTQSKRRIVTTRLDAPHLGDQVIYFEEYRAERPGIANRQRVTAITWDEKTSSVRAVQHFFAAGLSYDRATLSPDAVATFAKERFYFQPGCDLYFRWDDKNKRYTGGMMPKTCVYEHEVDGMVYAEFDMLLWPDQLWYRDRSKRVLNDTIRGEIDGFGWLRFEKRN